VLLAPLFRATLREPRAPADPAPAAAAPRASFSATLALLARKPSFWLMSVGAALSSMFAYGAIFWLPSFFGRSFHLTLSQTALYYGAILFFGGVAGIWAGGWTADRLGVRGKAGYCLTPAVAFAVAVPCYVAAITSPSLAFAFVLFLIPQALSLVWLGPVIAAVQHLAPARERSTASASFLFVNNLVGLGLGAPYFGYVSKLLKHRYGDESLKYAILSGLPLYIFSAILFVAAARRIARDWVD
jgi:MFS family permease